MIGGRVFRDLRVFKEDYLPRPLPVRQELVDSLVAKYLMPLERGEPYSDITLVYARLGRVGVGKTTIARSVGRMLEEIANRRGINLKYVYANAYGARSVHDIIDTILGEVERGAVKRGLSVQDKMSHLLDLLYMKNMRLFVVIDEVQSIFLKGENEAKNLYILLRPYEIKPSRVEGIVGLDFMLVAQGDTVLSLFRDMLPQVESQIGRKVVIDPYNTAELYKILLDRAVKGLQEGAWDESVIEKIACYYSIDCRYAGDPVGSARKAIIALRTAAEIAEESGSGQITDIHVSKALGRHAVAPISGELLRSLHKHEILVLLAIAELTLWKGDFVTTGEVRQYYEELASMYGEKPRGHTQFNEYMRELARRGLIIRKQSGKGMRGRTSLIRLPYDVPADILRSELILILRGRTPY